MRGPDWSCGDQDGGEGHVGTVVEVDGEGRSVMVQWDCGGRHRYRCGAEGKYDLRVFDSAPAGESSIITPNRSNLWICITVFQVRILNFMLLSLRSNSVKIISG